MKVAVVGAGFTGLSVAVGLVDKGVEVEVFEKANQVGGLAGGWSKNDKRWSLEYFYHHIFTNDKEIIEMAKKVGLPPTIYSPKTSSLINGKIEQLDSPLSVLKFSELSMLARFRMGLGLTLLKVIPNGLFLEKFRIVDLLPKLVGRESYEKVWKRLLVAKFGKKIEVVNMAWFWARIAKRTKNLGYFEGGFLALAEKMQEYVEKRGGKVYNNKAFEIDDKENSGYDKIIITTPGPIADTMAGEKLMSQIDYLWSQTLVLELNQSLMKDYWLNVLEKDWPFLVVVEHTNLVSAKNYAGRVIVYLGNYLEEDSFQLKMEKAEVLELYIKYLKKINSKFSKEWIEESFLFRAPFAQPVFPINYSKILKKIPRQKGKYLFANMSMVYPYDRGTNYAVKLGVEVAKKCLQ